MSVEVGSKAPEFTLKNQHGEEVSIASFQGKKNVVVLFYPFSFTGICTGELCGIRDDFAAFQNENVELVAISCDSQFTQRIFAEKENYQFSILSDFWPHGATAKAYGIFDEARGCALRGTFIIDKTGTVRWMVKNAIGDARSIDEYKAALAAL
jgi:peroxiredoxin